ncbi:MAG TPA: GNAT family N-acetyltransferase [Victivallales bacterium]|nr:GNAT family N-acetyltransferase [Victivallales bacterium]
MNLQYNNLGKTDLEIIYNVFIDAFSNYQIKLDMSLEKFSNMMKRRSVDFNVSAGVFDGKNLIGFILNGKRIINKQLVAYDSGTGLLQKYQGLKLAKKILEENSKLLKQNNIDKYILEVLTSNEKALNLYKGYGFKIIRKFNCFKNINKYVSDFDSPKNIKILKTNFLNIDWIKLKKWCDFQPSWQNSITSIKNDNTKFSYVQAVLDTEVKGYGIIEIKTGDIPLLVIDNKFRDISLGSVILKKLLKETTASSLSVLNIPTNCTHITKFLETHKFNNFVQQY